MSTFTVGTDGKVAAVAYADPSKLPPMILVGVNKAVTDVSPKATWLSKTDYKFEHPATADELTKSDTYIDILKWIAGRLDPGDPNTDAGLTGPLHGSLRAAWKSQESAINDWADPPTGDDEKFAQLFSELFSGINYNGTGVTYQMDFDGAAWDQYIYSRLQSQYIERVTTVDGSNKKTGKSIKSWKEPLENVVPIASVPTAYQANTDPAAPMCSSCQYLTTFAFICRGFRIELSKGELQTVRGIVGLSAAPAPGAAIFSKWVWRDGVSVTKIDDMLKDGNTLGPMSTYTFHDYHQLANQTFTVTLDPKGSRKASQFTTVWLLNESGKVKSKADDAVKKVNDAELATFKTHKADDPTLALTNVTINFNAQPQGSHIMHVHRVKKDKTMVQLFDARGGNDSRADMETEHWGTVLAASLGINMETKAYSSVYPDPNGVGFSKPAPDLPAQLTTMAQARPIGLARLILTERKAPKDLTADSVLYVSKMLRTYGNKQTQNYTVTRYLWSLRNTPYFSSIQPWWLLFVPRGVLARCMFAVGAREMTLDMFMKEHGDKTQTQAWFKILDKTLSIDVNYSESLILTNSADPTTPGQVQIIRRQKSEPVFPNGARLVTEGMELPAAFTQGLPGVDAPRNMIIPPLFTDKATNTPQHNPNSSFRSEAVYVRKDITSPDALSALAGTELDYFRNA